MTAAVPTRREATWRRGRSIAEWQHALSNASRADIARAPLKWVDEASMNAAIRIQVFSKGRIRGMAVLTALWKGQQDPGARQNRRSRALKAGRRGDRWREPNADLSEMQRSRNIYTSLFDHPLRPALHKRLTDVAGGGRHLRSFFEAVTDATSPESPLRPLALALAQREGGLDFLHHVGRRLLLGHVGSDSGFRRYVGDSPQRFFSSVIYGIPKGPQARMGLIRVAAAVERNIDDIAKVTETWEDTWNGDLVVPIVEGLFELQEQNLPRGTLTPFLKRVFNLLDSGDIDLAAAEMLGLPDRAIPLALRQRLQGADGITEALAEIPTVPFAERFPPEKKLATKKAAARKRAPVPPPLGAQLANHLVVHTKEERGPDGERYRRITGATLILGPAKRIPGKRKGEPMVRILTFGIGADGRLDRRHESETSEPTVQRWKDGIDHVVLGDLPSDLVVSMQSEKFIAVPKLHERVKKAFPKAVDVTFNVKKLDRSVARDVSK